MKTKKHWGVCKVDKILLLAISLGLIFGLYGINWGGWVEYWNPDQMAFKTIFYGSRKIPFEPIFFHKPPFHTYFNYFLCVYPFEIIQRAARKILNLSLDIQSAKIIWSRLLTIFLFLGSIALVFRITRMYFDIWAARIVALIFATSAGFIVESHFLTADIPVLFWMLVAFAFAQNISLRGRLFDYIGAGFFTGIATATKYNGLGVGIAIVVAHILISRPISWKALVFSKKHFLGLGMVVIGFFVGNPFAFDPNSDFIDDFWYNYLTTPVYEGEIAIGHSYGKFLSLFTEIIGLPSLIICLIAFLFAFYFLFSAENSDRSKTGVILLLSVFILYYWKFGSFPRLEVRFVMPIVPFVLMLSSPLINAIKSKPVIVAFLFFLITYNCISSFYVGKRFAEDPRMEAREWVIHHIPGGSYVEYTGYTFNWNKLPNVNLNHKSLPGISGRKKLFEEIFTNNPWLIEQVQRRERDNRKEWYALEELMKRQPDYIAVNSLYYDRFFSGKVAKLYPSIQNFFENLLKERYPYTIVFDQESQRSPSLLYPRQINFVDNRITILARNKSNAYLE
jgi:4-amino-4-deoxy-L-arabinose transferase-like glycosyltransferase